MTESSWFDTPKRTRTRLAKAEVLMALAVTAQRWSDQCAGVAGGPPMETWPSDDPMVETMRRYGLTPKDMARIVGRVAAETETRSMRAGYSDTWDDES